MVEIITTKAQAKRPIYLVDITEFRELLYAKKGESTDASGCFSAAHNHTRLRHLLVFELFCLVFSVSFMFANDGSRLSTANMASQLAN